MSTVTEKPVAREVRMIPMSRLRLREDFNPRTKFDPRQHKELVASLKLKGMLQSMLVAPDPEVEGEYLVTDGERRYRAAIDAALMEVPCIIDVPDAETDGLDDALITNQLAVKLTPLEEARAFQRLRDHGLSIKEIADRRSRSARFVKDRLRLLVLPLDVQRKVDAGEIPLNAAEALVALAEQHPELATVAVRKMLNAPDEVIYSHSYHRRTWADLVEDPVGVVLAPGYKIDLPSDVYPSNGEFPLSCFTLSEQAERDLAELLEIAVTAKRRDVRVTFDKDLIEHATALGATYAGANGHVLVIGQDVADQLAGDAIARMLREQQAREQAVLVQIRRETAAQANGSGRDAAAAREVQAAAQREEAKQARRQALAYNETLGAAALVATAKVRVDVRVLKILAAVDFDGRLGEIAARGARYCLPFEDWRQRRELDGGVVKVELLDANACAEPARTWLQGARGQADYAGRLLTLAILALFADETVLANGRRANCEVHYPASGSLPWTREVRRLIEDIALELLPEHLTKKVRDVRRDEQQRLDDAQALVDRALSDASSLTPQERRDARWAAYTLHGDNETGDNLRDRLDAALAAAEDTPPDEGAHAGAATDDEAPDDDADAGAATDDDAAATA